MGDYDKRLFDTRCKDCWIKKAVIACPDKDKCETCNCGGCTPLTHCIKCRDEYAAQQYY